MDNFNGLSWVEATKALREFGLNQIPTKRNSVASIFFKQLKSPLIFLLIITVIISFLLGNIIEGFVILLILSINTALGFSQEYKSRTTFQNLEKLLTSNVIALRNGRKVLIDKSTVVPGDVLFLKLGDIICADAFILEANSLEVDESVVTGESSIIQKQTNNQLRRNFVEGVVYSGTHIVEGNCVVKVFSTGVNSKIGKIVYQTETTTKVSEYEQNIKKLSQTFLYISIFAIFFIFFANLLVKQDTDIISLLLFTIAIAISIIPETFPIIANLTLSKSAARLGNKKVIVKHNSAIEDLGNIDVICTDKTGTLTLDKLKVDSYIANIKQDDFFKYSYLSTTESGDPVDKCIQNYLKNKGLEDHSEFLLEETPFNPKSRFSSRKFKDFEIIKGSPEYIFEITSNETSDNRNLIAENSKKGLRAISLALKHDSGIVYIGTFFFFDEIKKDIANVIQQARDLGISIKILTGDSLEVSEFVAKEVKLIDASQKAILASDIDFSNKDQLCKVVASYSVFARCTPEQKYKIIECLQTNHSVGYIGDGINDAPSLALANVGIVVNTATDIAKQKSDIILLSNELEVIIEGIIEGRKSFEHIDRYLKDSLAGNFGGFFTIGSLSVFLRFLPMLPIQIFISNLLTDLPLLTIYNDKVEKNELRKPKHHSIKKTLLFAVVYGGISLVFDLIFFYSVRNQAPEAIQTQWFAFSVFTEILVLFSLRNSGRVFRKEWYKIPKTIGLLSLFAIIVTILLSLFGLGNEFKGIPIGALGFVILIAIAYFIFNELVKAPLRRVFKF